MAGASDLKVPNALRPVFEEIIGITDAVCQNLLDDEYAELARRVAAKLARKRPSPLLGGRRVTWAAGIVYALGQLNFLADTASEPCASADQISEAFGVAKTTMGSKAKQIRDLLRMYPFSLEFQRADMVEQNPLAWLIEVDGIVIDCRHAPWEFQAEAYRLGLIPYLPALGPASEASQAMTAGTVSAQASPLAGLLERSSELKRQLVGFARSSRFSRQLDDALSEGIDSALIPKYEVNLIDHFILQRPLSDGRTVVEVFVAEHPQLSETDREMLLGWRQVVEGIFEVREREEDAIVTVNLADELIYRIRANSGPAALAPMRPGEFVASRIVPLGGDWMLSGAQRLYPASDRAALQLLAAG